MKSKKRDALTVRIDPEMNKRLKYIALQRDEDLTPLLVREALSPWLEQMESKYGRFEPAVVHAPRPEPKRKPA